VWPGDEPVQSSALRYDNGVQVGRFAMGAHTGTHVDAPRHVLGPDADGVEALDLGLLVGEAAVVDLTSAVPPGVKSFGDRALSAQLGDNAPLRLLLRLRPKPTSQTTFLAYPAPDLSAARWLVAHGVRLLGLDVPSVDVPEAEDLAVHRVLLEAGLVIVENLMLCGVPVGSWQFACLPLRLVGADGAPARVLLWR